MTQRLLTIYCLDDVLPIEWDKTGLRQLQRVYGLVPYSLRQEVQDIIVFRRSINNHKSQEIDNIDYL